VEYSSKLCGVEAGVSLKEQMDIHPDIVLSEKRGAVMLYYLAV